MSRQHQLVFFERSDFRRKTEFGLRASGGKFAIEILALQSSRKIE
jgi:urease accessory protein UreH